MLKKLIIILSLSNIIFSQAGMLSPGKSVGVWFESDLLSLVNETEFNIKNNELFGGSKLDQGYYEPSYAIKIDYLTKKSIEVGSKIWINDDNNTDVFAKFHTNNGIGATSWYAGLELLNFFDDPHGILNLGMYEMDSFGDYSLNYDFNRGKTTFKVSRYFQLEKIYMGVVFNIFTDDDDLGITMGLNIGNFIKI